MSHFHFRTIIASIYEEAITSKYKNQSFWILTAFIPTFMIVRLIVHFEPRIFLQVHHTHVHHFTYGIILLAISGYLSIIRSGRAPIWLAIMYGIGLALAVDETGMWLHLTKQYNNDTSEDAIVLVSALLINIVYFRDFWIKLVRAFVRQLGKVK